MVILVRDACHNPCRESLITTMKPQIRLMIPHARHNELNCAAELENRDRTDEEFCESTLVAEAGLNLLRFETQEPFEGLHVDRHRKMFVDDHPNSGDLAKTDGRAHPDISVFSACPCSSDPIKAAAEGYIAARSYIQVTNLISNWTLECRKPILPILSVRDCSFILQRRCEVVDYDLRCIMGHKNVYILRT